MLTRAGNNMDKNLVLAIVFLTTAYVFYILHKSWLKTREEKTFANKSMTKADSFRHWIVIIVLVILSIVYFFKSPG